MRSSLSLYFVIIARNISKSLILIFTLCTTLAYSQIKHVRSYYDKEGGIQGIDRPVQVNISPDDRHVYLTTSNIGVLVNFLRDSATGSLTHVETIYQSQPGISGIVIGYGIAISNDSKFVCIAAGEGALTVFRLESSDSLTFVTSINDSLVPNLYGASFVSFSPDNKHLYVTSQGKNALLVFDFDTSTGQIQFVADYVDDIGGYDGIDWPLCVRVSNDGKFVYVATRHDNGVGVFSRNSSTGALSFVQLLEWQLGQNCLQSAVSLNLSPDGKNVYVNGPWDSFAILRRNVTNGTLTLDTCVLGDQVGGTVDGINSNTSVAVSYDNQRVFVSSRYEGMASFSRDTVTGWLNATQAIIDGQNGITTIEGAEALVISHDDRHVYVVAEDDNAILAFAVDTVADTLILVESIEDNEGGIAGIFRPNASVLSPDMRHLYVAADYAVSVFERNDTTGELTFLQDIEEVLGTLINSARAIAISPDGKHVYLGCGLKLYVLTRNISTGFLSELQMLDWSTLGGCLQYESMSFSYSGRFLHTTVVCSGLNDGIITLSRDSITGLLTYLTLNEDNIGGNDGLEQCEAIAVSPDSRYLYVVSPMESSIARYEIDSISGILTFKEIVVGSWSENNGLQWPYRVAVSPDGETVYVATNTNSGALVVMKDNDTTGALEIRQVIFDGQMRDPRALAVAPDNRTIYMSSEFYEVIHVFWHDTVTGLVELGSKVYNSDADAEGMSGVMSITIDTSNRSLYTAALFSDAVTHFDIGIYFGDTLYACEGGSLVLTPYHAFQNHFWPHDSSTTASVTVTSSGTYTLTATGNYGEPITGSVEAVFYLPTVDLGGDTTIYFGDSAFFSPGWNYPIILWQDGSTNSFVWVKNESIQFDSVLLTVQITDELGCSNSGSITVYLNPTLTVKTEDQRSINIFPNPSQGEITIETTGYSEITRIDLHSINGDLVWSGFDLNGGRLSLPSLADGTYFLQIITTEGSFNHLIVLVNP